MANAKRTFNEKQVHILRQHGLDSREWELMQDFPSSMIIRHRITGEYKYVEKHLIPKHLGS